MNRQQSRGEHKNLKAITFLKFYYSILVFKATINAESSISEFLRTAINEILSKPYIYILKQPNDFGIVSCYSYMKLRQETNLILSVNKQVLNAT